MLELRKTPSLLKNRLSTESKKAMETAGRKHGSYEKIEE